MASRRMFSRRITDSTRFLRMPLSAQALYFQLGQHADDDGIVEAYPVMCILGAKEDDLKILVSKNFVTVLNSDWVTFINDWLEHNTIRADRKTDSIYKELLLQVMPEAKIKEIPMIQEIEKNQSATKCQSNDNQVSDKAQPNDRIGKDRLGKDKVGKRNIYTPSFEEVWKIYPKKKEKSASHKAYQARLNDGFTEEELLKATKAYVAECEKTGQWVKTAKTFFGPNTPFIDYLKAGEENAVQETEDERQQRLADEYNRKYGGM